MKRPDLKPNKLYTESEMAENFTSAVLQGIADVYDGSGMALWMA